MSRSRVRTLTNEFPYKVVWYDDTISTGVKTVQVKSESITDNNNQQSRPLSDVFHTKTYHFPYFLPPYRYWGPNDIMSGAVNSTEAWIPQGIINTKVEEACAEAIQNLKYKFYQDRAALVDRGESINFLAEMRDLPSMFKSLSKYSYLDWEFGWAPFCRDLTSILSKTQDTIDSIRGKIKSNDKPQQLSVTKQVNCSFVMEEAGIAAGVSSSMTFNGKAEIRLRGTYRVLYPDLADAHALERLRLDIEGFNADPATIWEAIPFSWLVDWFLPIGDSLKALSGSNFNPKLIMRGTISVKCTGTYELKSTGNGSQTSGIRDGDSFGGGTHTYYSRTALIDDIDSMFFVVPKWRLPIPDLRKSGILNDIFGRGSSLDDANKLRHQTRKDRRRINNRLKRGRKAPIG